MTDENKKQSLLDILKAANKSKNDKNIPNKKGKEPRLGKPSKGFGGTTVVRRSGRGG